MLIAGMEADICVLQAALGDGDRDQDVFAVADAAAARKPLSTSLAPRHLTEAGIAVVTTETVVFEWLERAGTPDFNALLAFLK